MDPKVFIIVNAVVCSLLVTIAHLGFGIANAYVSSKTTDAKGECGDAIWVCVMVLSILSFFAFFNGLWQLFNLFTSEDNEKKSTNWLAIGHLGVSIWACVAYFGASASCADFYQTNFPMLWDMLLANVVFFFVSLGIVVWVCVSSCCTVCCAAANESQRDRRDVHGMQFTSNV